MSATLDLRVGDVRERLRELPSDSVHCVVTSPPYFGLRSYDTPPQIWGGEHECDHRWSAQLPPHHPGQVEQTKWKNAEAAGKGGTAGAGQFCQCCAAWRGDLGLEPTPQMFVAHLVEIFQEVRRVLRPDGVCFLNIGDSFANDAKWGGATGGKHVAELHGAPGGLGREKRSTGLKPKDLCLVPQRLAIALQEDGWWVRCDVIWHKTNCLPESATDRPTRAHEYVWLLTKRAHYFWDQAAVMEPAAWERWGDQTVPKYEGTDSASGWMKPEGKAELQARRTPTWEDRKAAGATRGNLAFNGNVGAGTQRGIHGEGLSHDLGDPQRGRNLRSIWTIPTESYPGAHFAVMAKKLAEQAIRAGTSEKGCCPECGAPWKRDVTRTRTLDGEPYEAEAWPIDDGGRRIAADGVGHWRKGTDVQTNGWEARCKHETTPIPCTVLDPFAGSGTTMIVARRLGRSAIGIELNPSYAEQARERLAYWWRDPVQAGAEVADGQLSLLA